MSQVYGVDSEVGRLRTVLVHRPGAELRRVTPQHKCGMLWPAMPWAERAQQEHDEFTRLLRDHGVEVLYLTELLQDSLEYAQARIQATRAVLRNPRLGDELRDQLARYLDGLRPEELAQLLIMGLARDEFRGGRGAVFCLLSAWDYVIDPLPNLVFARDSSVWIGDSVAVTSPPGRTAEAELAAVVFGHHPLFAATKRLYEPGLEELACGDVVLLAPGVVAIGTGCHTSPAGMERLARRVLDSGFAHTVIAVLTRVAENPDGECLDTLCTLAGPDTVVMRPSVAYSLIARTITQRPQGLRLSHPQPFLEAAAQAMGIDRLRVIETGLAPGRPGADVARPGPGVTAGQWDDAGNLLVLGQQTVVSYERNVLTNARLEDAGIEVIRVPGSELAGCRGGPRALCCPVGRDPASMPDENARAA
ncbi:MAG: arginine deiminase [Nocardiopsaceae bacterium]|nr:arginine deiminase [Nocardiopsaceae bacterium]